VGEGARVKVSLEVDEFLQIKALAVREFETTPTILNRLLLWGFHKIHSPRYWQMWNAYFNQHYAERNRASA
jgi:hypothetical protein